MGKHGIFQKLLQPVACNLVDLGFFMGKQWIFQKLLQLVACNQSRSFLDLGPRLFTYKNLNLLFSETTGLFSTKFCM